MLARTLVTLGRSVSEATSAATRVEPALLLNGHVRNYRFTETAHAEKYRQLRPAYPKQLFENIVAYCKISNQNLKSALDVACGSGQGTHQLCNYFQRVTGVDVSEAQIVQAQKAFSATYYPQLTFQVGKAEELLYQEDNSQDLITIAQAVHWVEVDKFYREVKRVLRPGGTLAIYAYGNVKLDNEKASEIFVQMYEKTKSYCESDRTLVDNHYAAFTPLPFNDFKRVDDLSITKTMTLKTLIAYISTWSAYQKYINIYPDSQFLEEYRAKFLQAYNKDKTVEDLEVVATWPLFLLLGRKTG